MKRVKKVVLGSVSVIGLSLFLGACSTETSNVNVVSGTNLSINEGDALKGLTDYLGYDSVRKSMLYNVLDSYYKVSDAEIELGRKRLDEGYKDMGGIEGLKSYYGYDDEQVSVTIKNEMLLLKGFNDLRGYEEKDLNAKYEEVKNGKEGIEVVVIEESDNSKLVLKELSSDKSIEDLIKIAGDEIDKTIFIKYVTFVKGQTEPDYNIVFDKDVGDMVSVKNVKGNYISEIKIVKDIVLELEQLKITLEYDLLYGDLTDPEAWLFAKLVKDKKLKFGKDYEKLEGDSLEAIEALNELKKAAKEESTKEGGTVENDKEK